MKEYVVGLIFDNNMEHVLMLKRAKEPYGDLYNGVGGKIEPTESPKEAMIRETEEEIGLTPEFFTKTNHLLSLTLPTSVQLEVFYSILNVDKETLIFEKETREGILEWLSIKEDNLLDASNSLIAGDGNIAYFTQFALNLENK
ncbi:hypothetical protein CVD28_00345 [Bacillus sp. M6-12]|uniref:NUDIX domain-containing protein n=1 Tax=Bacillus sp. M6-12 TaxID=2054166 RepID=UPI000C76FB88|nr:NUDIX domain-containing protein [Bacillus sp. M6-12]PLS18885.1 hypothetical protein CVD28_00345 [Bacillus sp. M6-12]